MTRIELTRPGTPRYADAPLTLDARGRTARASEDEHVRDLIRAVLFTEPGERVNRPTFGCALKTLVFAPASDALASATQALVHGALQQWLEREIIVESVDVEADEAELRVNVVYERRSDGVRRRDVLAYRVAPR
jgi:phage baseplate assembly protein W